MNDFSFLMWLVPYFKLRSTKTNLPAKGFEVILLSTSLADTQSIAEDAENEDISEISSNKDQSDFELIIETATGSRKRKTESNISKVDEMDEKKPGEMDEKKPDMDREELLFLKSMQKAL